MFRQALLAATGLALLAPAALAETPQAAADRLDRFLDAFEGLGPGFAVVVVTEDDILLNRTTGVRRAGSTAPVTADTPLYIASQTKAYMGLLAAVLDERGVLSLDSTIADHWPDVEFPEGVDPAGFTLRDLLSHQVPISADPIVEIEAYIARIEPADYPDLISRFATARETGFEYDNLGYNIYGAILETVTGKTWQDWLDEDVFTPLELDRTSARTSDYSADEIAWNHTWLADENDWLEVAPKTDAMMQSAGGIMTTPGDMVVWLQTQLRGEGPEGSGISASAVAAALAPIAETHMEDGRNAYEQPCSHYSLGWNICDKEGNTLFIHGGGYTGARSMMAFSPELGVGIAAFANSDNMTGWVTSRTVEMYFQFLLDHPDAESWEQRRPELYPRQIERLQGYIAQRHENARAEEQWGGWSWEPAEAELSDYVGAYTMGVDYLDADLGVRDGVLHMWIGDRHLELEAAQPDLFGARNIPYDVPEAVRFERDASGRVTGLIWQEETYRRTR